jgi:mitotic spindle assembly checkpoint protein MAD2B
VDKVVLVIKDRMQVPLERYVFSVRTMLDIEAYAKDDP